MEPYFPHLSSTDPAPSAKQIYATYQRAFAQQVSDGIRRPVVFPDHFLTLFLLVVYLCIPHKEFPIIYLLRWPLVVFITWFEFCKIQERSSMGYGFGFLAGFTSAFLIISAWTWLVFMRPQWDAKRVQRIELGKDLIVDKYIKVTKPSVQNGSLSQRRLSNGYIGKPCEYKIDEEAYLYFWQSYPENLKDRISWVMDLIFNMRGPGWNWAISKIPSLPPEILKKTGDRVPKAAYKNILSIGTQRFNTRHELLFYHLSRYFICFIFLDTMKVIMMKDPYFKFGPTTYALPSHLKSLPPYVLQIYRQLVSAHCIMATIIMNFAQLTLLISYVCGPRIFGLRSESWYYPSIWGSFWRALENGLGGFWAEFWHQTFRFYFTAPYAYLLRKGFMRSSSQASRNISLAIAFSISAFIHWAGSISAFPVTYPSQMVSFFLLQAIGIVIQQKICSILSPYTKTLPMFIRYAGNFIFIFIWESNTCSLLADDLARGGFWISEPIPFSLLHLLGFIESDTRFSRWNDLGAQWYTGKHWWQSGFIA